MIILPWEGKGKGRRVSWDWACCWDCLYFSSSIPFYMCLILSLMTAILQKYYTTKFNVPQPLPHLAWSTYSEHHRWELGTINMLQIFSFFAIPLLNLSEGYGYFLGVDWVWCFCTHQAYGSLVFLLWNFLGHTYTQMDALKIHLKCNSLCRLCRSNKALKKQNRSGNAKVLHVQQSQHKHRRVS